MSRNKARATLLWERGNAVPDFVGAVRVPTRATLRRYGLDLGDWLIILERQGRTCGGCPYVPASGILHIDHEHVRGFAKMPPDEKRQYVRGLACWRCNSVPLRRGATPTNLRKAADYLDRYLESRAA